ncbi:MAG: hypothetical protein V1792_01205, partial [Pseudomonadota bacterium]
MNNQRAKEQVDLVFVCVSNMGRSVFAEFFLPKIIREAAGDLLGRFNTTSAGFIPQAIKDHLAELNIDIPDPFYGRPIPETTRSFLAGKGIIVPPDWRSKELTPAMVEGADLIITAIPQQKEDLCSLYPETTGKILTIREISRWEGGLKFESFTRLPKDNTYWEYVEEDEDYVTTILSEMEKCLTLAFPHILER